MNLFVLVISVSSRKLRNLRSTYLVISLTVADLLVCAGVMPLTPFIQQLKLQSKRSVTIVCFLWHFITTFACTTSSLNICAISIDRYIFIMYPLLYDHKMSQTRMRLLLLSVWFTGLVVAVMSYGVSRDARPGTSREWHISPQYNLSAVQSDSTNFSCNINLQPGYQLVLVIIALFVPSLVVIVLYTRIYMVVRSQVRALRRIQSTVGICSTRIAEMSSSQERMRSRSGLDIRSTHYQPATRASMFYPSMMVQLQPTTVSGARLTSRFSEKLEKLASLITLEAKASFVLSIVIGTYLLSWLPFGLFVLVQAVLRRDLDGSVREILLVLGYSNSCWNPLIYAGFNQLFRESLSRNCRKILRRRRAPSEIYRPHTPTSHSTSHPKMVRAISSRTTIDCSHQPYFSDQTSVSSV
ncbi:hypothetical protein RRG08_021622 [Elysia crispata]|uniref:G-protein coupled receptors family 1 profile domain-containing protein n=1 Tax=Elysia crispata TaxID=231223 RepID=A0AAE0XDY0_9GAST|nr:hypothetical protein RRG08_021622 [Elysia crispata]